MRIGIIGTGIAGNAAAWALSRTHQVTVYEKELRPGGHSHTVTIDYDGKPLAVDTGFIVYNEHNYPNLTALFAHLGVATHESAMSFAVSSHQGRFECRGGGDTWLATANGLFAQRRNLFAPSYIAMLRDILRFNTQSVADRDAGLLGTHSLGSYFAWRKFSPRLLHDYLAPMGAAIWSTPADQMLAFPAENFVAFFDNHRLLQYDRPKWRTVAGGSARYVARLTEPFRDRVRLGCAVTEVRRLPHGVEVRDSHGGSEVFDHVVMASHCDQTLAMIADPMPEEAALLGAIGYRPNAVYLHRDTRLMPKRRRAWASWNFLRWSRDEAPCNDVAVTYWMNSLQDIDAACPLFVSLNPPFAPDPDLTFGHYLCEHPQYDHAAFAAIRALETIQGKNRLWFCGAWNGYGFHEDGLKSGLAVAEALGAEVPWRTAAKAMAVAAE